MRRDVDVVSKDKIGRRSSVGVCLLLTSVLFLVVNFSYEGQHVGEAAQAWGDFGYKGFSRYDDT